MIVHGKIDHSGVYAELAQQLVKAGIAVFAMDMRGWGLSDGESMYVDRMNTFVSDVEAFYKEIHQRTRYENTKQRFLFAKSLGGTVTAYCGAAKYPDYWTGLIGLSGAYQIDPKVLPSSFLLSIVNGLAMIHPKLPFKKPFEEHLIVLDEQALEAWRQDPLCSKDKVRIGYIVNLFRSIDAIPHEIAPKIDLPMIMMVGDADQLVTRSGHELMLQNGRQSKEQSGKNSDRKLHVYAGGYHKLLAEPALKAQVMEDIETWILEHAAA